MHIIIGFAIIVGLLAVPATRKVMFALAGMTMIGLVIFYIVDVQVVSRPVQHVIKESCSTPEDIRRYDNEVKAFRLSRDYDPEVAAGLALIQPKPCQATGRP